MSLEERQKKYVDEVEKEPNLKVKRIVRYATCKELLEQLDPDYDLKTFNFLKKHENDNCWFSITIDEKHRKNIAKQISESLKKTTLERKGSENG